MTSYVWIHSVEAECTMCLGAVDTQMGLPNDEGTDTWDEASKHPSEDYWAYADGTYPKMIDGEWVGQTVISALGGITTEIMDTPASWQAVKDEAVPGVAVRIPRDKAKEYGFFPDPELP